MIKQILRFLTRITASALLFIILTWILVFHRLFEADSKMTGLAFFPPYGFLLLIVPLVLIFLALGDKKSALFTVGAYLLFFLAYGDFSFNSSENRAQAAVQSQNQFSVVALNVRYYSYGLDNVISAIKEMDADLYLLSENVITEVEKKKLEASIHPWFFHMGRQEGTAIISRYPVTEFKEIELPSKQASLSKSNRIKRQHLNPNRSFVHAVMDVNGTKVHGISIRFLAGRPAERSFSAAFRWAFYVLDAQMKELAFFLDYLEKLDGPVIFGGDLNATPSSIVLQKLSDIATDSYLEKHFWGGFTFWTQFPPYARLDYLFSMNGAIVEESRILDLVVSDHYPVFGRYRIVKN